MDKRVAGVVVLYNPPEDVADIVSSYIHQVQFIYIIDNSRERLPGSAPLINNYQDKIEYIFNGVNLGVAAAINLGARKAVNAGYSFLLTMDQDSKAPPNMVASLIEVADSKKNIGIVSPLHSNKFGTHLKFGSEAKEVMSVMTSGNLLSLAAFNKIGGFCEDFFIDYVDIEYCIRLNYFNFKVVQLGNIILEHDEANISEKRFFFRKFYPTNNVPFRMYYKTRNLLYLRERYKNEYPRLLRKEYDVYLRNFVKIILFEKQRLLKIKMIFLGVLDYFNKKKGRRF
ncbi:MAG: glycosyltransferase [Ignavibacteria bacterium]